MAAAPGHTDSKDGEQVSLLHQCQVDFFLKGTQVASGESQDGVRLLHGKAVTSHPKLRVVDRIYGRAELPTDGQHHIMRPPNRFQCCIQIVRQRPEASTATTGELLCQT